MQRIVNNKTISGDWILAGGKVERVTKDAIAEQFPSHAIEITNIYVSTKGIRVGSPKENVVSYDATLSLGGIKTKISGIGECYLSVYDHPALRVIYSTYMRVYWKAEK